MMSDVGIVDGSWQLGITVTDLEVVKTLRVKGDLHIGGVMLQLVEALDIAFDWSDHALWWPLRNRWLNRTRSTLDQYGVQADAKLEFTPMHKTLQIQLPSLKVLELRVDFSCNVFGAVLQICKKCGIRHPEELSLMRKLEKEDMKKNTFVTLRNKRHQHHHEAPHSPTGWQSPHHSSNSLDRIGNRSPMTHSPHNTLSPRTPMTANSLYSAFDANNSYIGGSLHSLNTDEIELMNSPHITTKEAFNMLLRPKTNAEKARINKGWLDSSVSLMEQGIRERDILLLKFKFFTFYDLSPKYDSIRINQIYEQAKWALISEEVDCTEEEMTMFAGLQMQIELQSEQPQPEIFDETDNHTADDDIDSALTELQKSLEGTTHSNPTDITNVPELGTYIKIFKPKKFTLKNFKRFYCVFREYSISLYKSKDDICANPISKINTKGCETSPDVNLSSKKYGIKLFEPTKEGMSEIWLRLDTEECYCQWMAACRLASKGKTMADSTYESEVNALKTFLSMQQPASGDSTDSGVSRGDIHVENYVAPRFARKLKSGQIVRRITDAHSNVKDLNLTEAKLAYIKAWQALPEYGITYFIIKMNNNKKEELIGVASNRIIRMDLSSGDSIKTWRYNTLQTWTVNWESRKVILAFEEEEIVFDSLASDCKVVHEFIGGYIFLSMRSSDKSQTLDEALFHKLTGGRL